MEVAPSFDTEITKEALVKLPHLAIVAFAARVAWRVLPATIGLKGKGDRAAVVAALSAAGLFAIGRSVDRHVLNATRKSAAVAYAVAHAAANAAAAAYVAVADAAAYAYAAAAADAAADADAGAGAAVKQANQQDLTWLLNWSSENRLAEDMVRSGFFDRPLWEGQDEDYIPRAWMDATDRWSKSVADMGLEWLA